MPSLVIKNKTGEPIYVVSERVLTGYKVVTQVSPPRRLAVIPKGGQYVAHSASSLSLQVGKIAGETWDNYINYGTIVKHGKDRPLKLTDSSGSYGARNGVKFSAKLDPKRGINVVEVYSQPVGLDEPSCRKKVLFVYPLGEKLGVRGETPEDVLEILKKDIMKQDSEGFAGFSIDLCAAVGLKAVGTTAGFRSATLYDLSPVEELIQNKKIDGVIFAERWNVFDSIMDFNSFDSRNKDSKLMMAKRLHKLFPSLRMGSFEFVYSRGEELVRYVMPLFGPNTGDFNAARFVHSMHGDILLY